MSQIQKNFNAKARASTAGSRKKGKLKRKRNEGQPAQIEEDDPNASILIPKTKEQKDQERREKLRQEVCISSEIVVCEAMVTVC
jgi:ATP-dependent RNA helicase DHX37/DHR1